MRERFRLFLLAFIQIALVSANSYFIPHDMWPQIFGSCFLISYIWSHNVKRVAFGSELDRVIYGAGAALGGLAGWYISKSMI